MNWQIIICALAPQHLLLAGFFAIMLTELALPFCKNTKKSTASVINESQCSHIYSQIAICAIILSFIASIWLFNISYSADVFPNQFSVTPTKLTLVAIITILALPSVIYASSKLTSPRYFMLILASTYGASLLQVADSFVAVFLSIEIAAIPVYAMVATSFSPKDGSSAEAAFKYLIMGAIATAMMLLGSSFFLGASGSATLAISDFINSANNLNSAKAIITHNSTIMSLAIVFLLISLFIKASIAPFHTWAPDAYGSANLPTTSYMSVVIKVMVLFVSLRIFGEVQFAPLFISILFILPLLSMLWGNLAAINQTNFRRLIGYSSVAHAGYLFFAFLGVAGVGRYQAISYYALVYGFASFLAFLVLPKNINHKNSVSDDFINLKGLYYRSPFSAVSLSIAMLSLAGLPPFPGFIGKFLIFKNVLTAGYTVYAILGLLASFAGLFVYLRVAQLVFSKVENSSELALKPTQNIWSAVICLIILIYLLIFPQTVLELY